MTTQPPSTTSADDTDLALVARIRAGEQQAWSHLITAHQTRLFNICLRMVNDRDLATDLTQDAFVKIIQGIDSFDGRSKLSTWMIRITMNVCLSKLRSEKLRRHASLDAPLAHGDAEPTTHAAMLESREPGPILGVESTGERALLARALAELDPDQRAMLILADARGVPYEQIAQALGIAVGTVKSRVFRARTTLRDLIESLQRTAR